MARGSRARTSLDHRPLGTGLHCRRSGAAHHRTIGNVPCKVPPRRYRTNLLLPWGTYVHAQIGDASRRIPSSRGQGLVEFAIAVPVLLLILLIVIDAGRLFYGYVALQNASRIAASYAADHADAWPGPSSDQAEYIAMVTRDTQSLSCTPQPVPTPTFNPPGPPPRTPGPGHSAQVTLQCAFRPFAPLISAVSATR